MSKVGFDFIINIGNTSTDFLDVTLDLSSNNFYPFKKPNSKICYICNGSNHPKKIRENIPKMNKIRLSKLGTRISSIASKAHNKTPLIKVTSLIS